MLTGLESFNDGHRELVIFDRWYQSDEFIGQVEGYGVNYVIRLPKRFSPAADRQEERDGWIPLGKSERRVHCIKVELSSGEKETLITNLSESEVEGEAFGELYHKRWKIETKYDMVKKKLELENFSGRLVETEKQDFYAMMRAAHLTAGFVREANRKAKRDREGSRTGMSKR